MRSTVAAATIFVLVLSAASWLLLLPILNVLLLTGGDPNPSAWWLIPGQILGAIEAWLILFPGGDLIRSLVYGSETPDD